MASAVDLDGRNQRRSRVVWGLILIGFGVLLLLNQFELVPGGIERWFWTLIIMGLGVAKLFQPGDRASSLPLIVIGALLFLHMTEKARMSRTWPLITVAVGASIVLGAFERKPSCDRETWL
jgi:hypothetical protein